MCTRSTFLNIIKIMENRKGENSTYEGMLGAPDNWVHCGIFDEILEKKEDINRKTRWNPNKIWNLVTSDVPISIYFFLFRKNIYFNWRLMTLQYCSGFCHILTWISHGCTCVPHPEPYSHLPPHSIPSGSSQCTSPEHPVPCIEPGLVICFTYDNIHVSVLFSEIIPPLPSPIESKRLFYTSVSLFLFCI